MRPSTQLQDGFAPRLAAFYSGLFIMAGIQLPFFPVWLKAKGLDPQMIGLVLAAPIVARMIAVPLVARAADRREALRAAIIVASFLGAGGYVLVGLAEGAAAILAAYALAALALTPVMPLADSTAVGWRSTEFISVISFGAFSFECESLSPSAPGKLSSSVDGAPEWKSLPPSKPRRYGFTPMRSAMLKPVFSAWRT